MRWEMMKRSERSCPHWGDVLFSPKILAFIDWGLRLHDPLGKLEAVGLVSLVLGRLRQLQPGLGWSRTEVAQSAPTLVTTHHQIQRCLLAVDFNASRLIPRVNPFGGSIGRIWRARLRGVDGVSPPSQELPTLVACGCVPMPVQGLVRRETWQGAPT